MRSHMGLMRFHLAPPSLLQLTLTILLTPPTCANPSPETSALAGFSFNELFARWDCSGQYCGYSSQLCCTAGSTCYTNAADQAACGVGSTYATTTTNAGGYWEYYTTTYTSDEYVTVTSVMSSYVGGTTVVPAAATTGATCNYALNQVPCGDSCCDSGQYCYAANTCSSAANGGSSGYSTTYTTPGATAGAPIRGTSSSLVVVTATSTPSTTVPFESPVATGANVTLTSQQLHSGTHLSGGAIAGIVVGVLVGLFLLTLLCVYCCLWGLLDGCLALFGLGGRRKRRTTEVEEYERRSHRTSGGGIRRTWYGAARPARSRYEERTERRDRTGAELLGLAGCLAALWAILGLKRRNRKRNEEKFSEVSYSSDYYTSASSESSGGRRLSRPGGRGPGRPIRGGRPIDGPGFDEPL